MSRASDLCRVSTMMTAALGNSSIGARARRLPDYHQQGQAGSGMRAATAAPRRLVLAVTMIIWLSMDLDVIFIMFEVLCTSGESL